MSRSERLIAETEKYLAHNYHPLPVVFTKASGAWYEDADGNRILDMLAGYSAGNHGHCHPRITRSLIEQCQRLVVAPRAGYTDKLPEFGRTLTEFCRMGKVLPMNSGAEAFETAIKISRKWGYKREKKVPDNQAKIIVCHNNFHGRTPGAVGASDVPEYRDGFGPFLPGFEWIDFGDPDSLGRIITKDKKSQKNTVAFIVEPIQGEGGINIPPDGYLIEIERICRKYNVLLVFDEVQTGFGRTGYDFAHQREGVRPDILIIGKSLGGGLAVSAVLADDHIMNVIGPGDHGSTFGGNPLACAVAVEAVNVLKDERLTDKSAILGDYFLGRLREIKSPLIKEVRGRGLMIGLELAPCAGVARPFCEALLKEGIFCKETRDTVIRFTPPLVISMAEIDWAVERIKRVFTKI